PDDAKEEVIQNRINVYNEQTLPVKEYYEAQEKYFGVDGVGDIDSIFNRLCDTIDSTLVQDS
ncbi:MAG: adenylate kinase, partial [Flavobacteriales bacterium]|nr:adenylate kinase [Flavobacteriales bacterium]